MRTALYTGSTPVNARSPGEIIVGPTIDMHYGKVCRTDRKSSSDVRFSLSDEFDFFNKPELAATIASAETARRMTLDLGAATSIDASILGLFVGIARRRKLIGASQVHIVNVAAGIRKLFTICKLESVFRLAGPTATPQVT